MKNPIGPSGTDQPKTFAANLTLRSMRKNTPIAGALVTTLEKSEVYISDADGRISIPKATDGEAFAAYAPGFISSHIFLLRSTAETEYLWEDDAALPYAYTHQLIYNGDDSYHLVRPVSSVMSVFPSAPMRQSSRAMGALSWAVNLHNASNRDMRVRIAEDDRESAEMRIDIREDASDRDNPGALAYPSYAGYTITGGRIVFISFDAFYGDHLRRAIVHELTHLRGLADAPGLGGMMGSPDAVSDFSYQEKQLLHNINMRLPGNLPPDDSRQGNGVNTNGCGQCGGLTPELAIVAGG